MSGPSDAQLLKEWSTRGSEEAFAILARRYAGLLYHAALRRTGREDLAQEAAQNALLVLARKSPALGESASLAGWLHRTACYEATNLLRRETRHAARMKQVPAPDSQDDGPEVWQEVAPLLDQALDSLREKDRELIFLRYFQGLSFEEIARRCGGESAAWRQRSSRAIEKLRSALTKRGAAVSGSVLATGLGSSLSQAAPAPVLAALTSSPAAGAAALSWTTLAKHSLHLMKLHPATALLVTLLLTALPLSVQAFANASARQRIATMEAAALSAATGIDGNPPAQRATVAARPAKQNLLRLAEMIAEGNNGSRLAEAEAARMIKSLSFEELEELLRESVEVELPTKKRIDLINDLFQEYCFFRLHPSSVEQVLEMAALLSDRLGTEGQEMVWDKASVKVSFWASQAPDRAVAWYQEQIAAGRLDSARLDLSMAGRLYSGLRKADQDTAEAFYESLTEDARISVIREFQRSGKPEEFLDMAAKFDDAAKRQDSLKTVFRYGTKGKTAEEVREWIDRSGTQEPEHAAELFALAAEGDPYRDEDGDGISYPGLKIDEITARIAWLKDPATGGDSARAIGIFLASTMKDSPQDTHKAMSAECAHNPDQEMLSAYIRHSGGTVFGVVDALDRYRLLTDLEGRERILRELLASPAGKEVLEMMRERGISDEILEKSELPLELFR